MNTATHTIHLKWITKVNQSCRKTRKGVHFVLQDNFDERF